MNYIIVSVVIFEADRFDVEVEYLITPGTPPKVEQYWWWWRWGIYVLGMK